MKILAFPSRSVVYPPVILAGDSTILPFAFLSAVGGLLFDLNSGPVSFCLLNSSLLLSRRNLSVP